MFQVSIYLDIWSEMKIGTDDIISSQKDLLSSSHFPEPPHVRERLIKEIKFFITHLKKKMDESVHVGSVSYGNHSHLVEYVKTTDAATAELEKVGISSRGSRPQSAISSRDGNDTPTSGLVKGR